MSSRIPLVIINGQISQLPSGDTLNAPINSPDVLALENANAGSIVIGSPVYMKSNGEVDLSRANAGSTAEVFGLVFDTSITASATGNIITNGPISATTAQWDTVTGGSGGLTPGSKYWLDPATAGKLTLTAPTTVGQFVTYVGTAVSTTEMDFDPTLAIAL